MKYVIYGIPKLWNKGQCILSMGQKNNNLFLACKLRILSRQTLQKWQVNIEVTQANAKETVVYNFRQDAQNEDCVYVVVFFFFFKPDTLKHGHADTYRLV